MKMEMETETETQETACEQTAAEVSPSLIRSDSALRSSIAKYGSNSYYYAHAPLPAAAGEAKKIEGPGIVTGGSPTLLASAKAEEENAMNAKEAVIEAFSGRCVRGGVTLNRYTWCNSDRFVKLYIHLNSLREGEEESEFIKDKVEVEFGKDRVAIAIEHASGLYVLAISRTYASIVPKESSFVVTANRITVTLKKEEEGLTWFNLNRD